MNFLEVLRKEALQPFHKNTGTWYPTRQADIEFHRASKFLNRNNGSFLSIDEATEEILYQNSVDRKLPLAREEQQAIENLVDLVLDVQDGCRWGPDLAIKCFKDLDLVFFGGRLEGYVCVSWCLARNQWLAKLRCEDTLRPNELGVTFAGSKIKIRFSLTAIATPFLVPFFHAVA